ncbi:MFS transporter [Natronobacterium gregoryi]|nr:MFS transporter [Natronobacterium gregoryi]ELY63679.1 major facilitator family phosphoglycerate transporter [Natronobacterium gregoryi SP2]
MNVRTAVGDELKALWAGGKGTSLVVVATAWGLLVGARMIYPVVLPYLQDTYGLSLSVAGLLVTVLWLFGSLGQLPGGLLADRYDERLLLTASTLIVAVALGAVVTSASPVVLFLATAVWGLGHSLYPIARITFLSNRYADRLGSALGVTMATGDVGQTVLPPIAAAIAAAVAWQAGLGFVAPLLFLGSIVIFVVLPTTGSSTEPANSTSLRDTLGILTELRNPAMGFMSAILFLYIFIWQSFTAFYPTYLTSVKELSPSVASLLFGLFFAVGVVVKPVAGAAYDRIGMRGSLVIVLLPPVVGFTLLPLVDSVWVLVGVTALISTMLGSGAITQSYLADSFSEEMQGTGLGVIRTATATLGAGGPVLFGVIADYGFFDQGYFALAGIMAVVILLTLRMPRS